MPILDNLIVTIPAADLAALKAVDTTGRSSGLEIEVITMGKFILAASSVAAADDRDIVAPTSGPGRWFRQSLPTMTTTVAGKIASANLPQAIDITATPTFASETLTATTNQMVLGVTNTTTINSIAPAASRVVSIQDLGAAGNVVLAKGTTAKKIIADISGSTDAKVMTLVSAHTDNRSITFPDATGTVVTLEAKQAFTDATDASNATTAALTTAGGFGIAKKLYVGTSVFLPTTGGTPSGLAYYEKTTHVTTLTGIWAAGQAITFQVERTGTRVTITWPTTSAAVNGAAKPVNADAFLARFRPSADIYLPIGVVDNSVNVSGWCVFATSGVMTFSVGAFANFTNSGNGGILGGNVTFVIT
jgi:hypothetical protein